MRIGPYGVSLTWNSRLSFSRRARCMQTPNEVVSVSRIRASSEETTSMSPQRRMTSFWSSKRRPIWTFLLSPGLLVKATNTRSSPRATRCIATSAFNRAELIEKGKQSRAGISRRATRYLSIRCPIIHPPGSRRRFCFQDLWNPSHRDRVARWSSIAALYQAAGRASRQHSSY